MNKSAMAQVCQAPSCHEQAGAQDSPPHWDGVVTVPLGVLLPCRFVTPGLHQAIACHGLQVEQLGDPEPTDSQPAEAATALQAEPARETPEIYAESA